MTELLSKGSIQSCMGEGNEREQVQRTQWGIKRYIYVYYFFFETVLLDVRESASVFIQKISLHSKVISQKTN